MILNARRLINAVAGKAFKPPVGGWTAESFRREGAGLIATLHRTARIVQRQQGTEFANRLDKILKADLKEILSRVREMHAHEMRGRSVKAELSISIPNDEGIWMEAIASVLKDFGAKVKLKLVPVAQSTLMQGYSKTSLLLGQEPVIKFNERLAASLNGIADRVTRISETTREQLMRAVHRSVADGMGVVETANRIDELFPEINARRSLTIARTEMSRAWNQGAVTSFKESDTITQVSVIGCESREEDRWDSPSYQQFMYRGESTCNIQDVPVADADKLNFHPNHTGTMIPSGFSEGP